MLEAVIKPEYPEDFKRIIAITYRFSAGWRKIHNADTGHDVADNLTTTEFAISMLAARGWTNQEIASHMNISVNTVKWHIANAMQKLGIGSRQDLKNICCCKKKGFGYFAGSFSFPTHFSTLGG